MTDIIVAGGGPAGLTAALYAVRAGRSVLVLEEAAPGGQINFSPLVENYPGLPGVSGLQLSEALTRQAEGRLTGLRVRQASTGQTLELPLDGVFAAVGRVPGTAPFRAQLELDEEGYFRSGEDCRTRLPGVFVAGDCRAKEVRQLATAVGDGAVAGLAAARFVEDGQG